MTTSQLRIKIDPALALPLWKQVEQGFRTLILDGVIQSESILPGSAELAKQLGINPAATAKAYHNLLAAGLLENRRWGQVSVVDFQQLPLSDHRQLLLREGAREFAVVAHREQCSEAETIACLNEEFRMKNEEKRNLMAINNFSRPLEPVNNRTKPLVENPKPQAPSPKP